MDISSDSVRRALHDIDQGHRAELASTAETIDRLYHGDAPAAAKWDIVAGGANRTTWMKVGGVTVLTSAVLAACGGGEEAAPPPPPGPAGPTTTRPEQAKEDPADLKVFRFAASLENLAVAAYDTGAPLLKDPAMIAAAKLFQEHHKDHAELFNSLLKANGEKAFTEPNSVVLSMLKPQIDALTSEAAVLAFAQDLELKAASTYFSTVGVLQGKKLAYTTMTIGGTEYRHAALLSAIRGVPIESTKQGFLTTTEAIAPVGV
ncbi:MAG: ferritin-like domain-containing protein [Acidimicrobiales bacterium]